MTENNNKLWIAIAISVIIIIIITTISYKKYIKPSKSDNIVKVSKYNSAGQLLSSTTSQEKSNTNPVLGFFIIFLVIILFGVIIYITFMRYKIAYKSVETGNTALGIAALSPEIGSSIKNLFKY